MLENNEMDEQNEKMSEGLDEVSKDKPENAEDEMQSDTVSKSGDDRKPRSKTAVIAIMACLAVVLGIGGVWYKEAGSKSAKSPVNTIQPFVTDVAEKIEESAGPTIDVVDHTENKPSPTVVLPRFTGTPGQTETTDKKVPKVSDLDEDVMMALVSESGYYIQL